MKRNIKKGFTLAEILITLTIVGVVASMTIPALIQDIGDDALITAHRRNSYLIREAARITAILNSGTSFTDSVSYRDALAKRLSAIKSCDTVTDCFHTTIKDVTGTSVTVPVSGDTLGLTFGTGNPIAAPGNAVGLRLNNGTWLSILYNPNCRDSVDYYDSSNDKGANRVCANIIFDTNGSKEPNQVGKDIGFATVINKTPTSVVVASPIISPATETIGNWAANVSACTAKGTDWSLPSREELNAIFYNQTIIGTSTLPAADYATGVSYNANFAWGQAMGSGTQIYGVKTYASWNARCVKR